MRAYGQIHSSFWTSATIRGLTDDGRILAAYLLTSPHTNMIGCFRLPDGYACDDLGWPADRVSKAFSDLDGAGFASRTSTTKWVLIHKFLKWSPVKGPKQAKGAANLLLQVPEDEPLRPRLISAIERFSPDVTKPIERGSDRVSEPYRLQEPTKPEPDITEPKGSGAAAPSAQPSADPPQALDWPTRLFREGLAIVVGMTGKSDPAVRTLIGKWRKTAQDDCRQVLRVIEDARDHNPADPVAFIEAALRNRGKPEGDAMTMMRQRH
jgi:hypothetical protein